jgi:hypothetical protein
MYSWPVFVLPWNNLRDQTELLAIEAVRIKYEECVSAFVPLLSGMQIASFLRHIMLSCVACLTLPHFSTLSHKLHDFQQQQNIEHKMCVFIFSINLKYFLF